MSTTMGEQQDRQASFGGVQARAPNAGMNEPRIAIRNLDFFYGSNRALKNISLDLPDRQVTGMIGPSGCGKSTLLRVLNRMYDLYPGQRATGEVMMDGENIIDPVGRPQRAARADRHGVPEADAVSDDDLRQHRVRREAAREAVQGGDGRARGVVADPRRAVGRGEGPAAHLRHGPVRRPAAAALHRAHHRGAARGDPARRTDQRARPDQHAEDRGADRRAEARLHHRHRDAQHAAGRALRRPGGVLLPGRDGGGGARGRRCSPRPSERRTQEYITGRFG